MASHIEMKRLAEDAAGIRSLAAFLIAADGCEWTDWELDFLDHMCRWEGPDALSMRQREVLADLRDRSELARDWRGIPVTRLVRACHEARLDLDEDDEDFVASLHARDPSSLRRRQLQRLTRIAARLGLIEPHLAAAPAPRPETERNAA